ncbi:hypothetical protein BpHYR1_003846 [Brachionus plicatilis]|uniref:Uncharacterized protein n=1 Tax=Brachionus plicatilis TaxID=10195 RepID=A0A3M7RWL7_BRAPC|nr:hypothetical protein BpHYR1_003846 [Brachionus plicatilis]
MCSRGKNLKNNVVLPNYISDSDTSDGENGVEKICKNNFFNQNDEDKPFVADYLINYGVDMDYDEIENQDEVDEKDDLSLPFFRLFITTKRLLE